MDSGIYRIISSRRGSQSDEDSCSLHSQTLSEDERLKEFTLHQEEDQPDQCWGSHGNEGDECFFLLVADEKQLFSVTSLCQNYLVHRVFYKVLVIFIVLIDFSIQTLDLLTTRRMGLCVAVLFLLVLRLTLIKYLILIRHQSAGEVRKEAIN